MSTLVISKESLKTWLHTDSILGDFIISKFYFNADNLNFQIVEQGKSKRVIYNVTDITLYNTIGGGIAETFTTITALSLRLEQLNYPAFQVDGQITSIANLIESGSGVTITGDGTEASPYIISATGGGGGSQTLQEVLTVGDRSIDYLISSQNFVDSDKSMLWVSSNEYCGANVILTLTPDSFTTPNAELKVCNISDYTVTIAGDLGVTLLTDRDVIGKNEIGIIKNLKVDGDTAFDNTWVLTIDTSASTSPTSILTTTITDGDTTHAPDGNSVFDALANVNTNAVDKVTVKLSLGITKGQAVYISSANGTNIIVAKASNSAESTSSKTLGLLETTGVTNDIVNVITNGLLDGLDTSAATVGDAVWLGTSGNLIYGLASKPVAPAHLVYIGVVSRVSATVGEIIVKIQNGFELNEIHDVSISGLADNNLLAYESATSLWKNKTASTLGIAPLASPTFTGTVVLPSTTSIGTVSDTEIGYLDNVTSSIQTQFTNLHYKNILKDNSFWWTPTSVSNNAGATGFQYSPYSNNNSVVIQGNSNSINPLGYIRFSTTAVAGTLAVMRRNDFLILTGFSCTITRKIRFETNISGQRFFCGFSKNNQFTAPTNVEPNTLTDIVGVCQMSSSTNMQVVHNDASGTATLIDLGSSYPCNDTQYNYFITIEQTTTTYIVTVERVTVATGASISTSNTLSTNIPVYNTGTIQICTWITNNATASIASYLDGGGYGTFKN